MSLQKVNKNGITMQLQKVNVNMKVYLPFVLQIIWSRFCFDVTTANEIKLASHNLGLDVSKTLNPGDRIHIPCPLMNPGGSVQWVQNNKPIMLDFSPTQRRHWNISSNGKASLTINRVTKSDEGDWECWELNNNGNVKSKEHILKIYVTNAPEGPFLMLDDSRRLEEDEKISVRENHLVTIKCIIKVASSAVNHVNWFIAGDNVTHSSQLLMDYSAQDDNYETQSVLTINVTKEDHRKSVICQAKHISWSRPVSVSASLNVLYEPLFSISRDPGFGYPIIEGMSVYLKCEIDANPKSQVRWVRDAVPTEIEVESQSNGTLSFDSITVSDSGWYRCTTKHEFGHFASFGYFLNVRTTLPQLQNILKLPLSPSSSSSNFGSVQAREHERKPNKEAERRFSSGSNPMDIMINSGPLQEFMRRERFKDRPECGHAIGKPIMIAFNKTVNAMVGRPVSFYVQFCCDPRPKKVYWIHRHLALPPSIMLGPYITRELVMAGNSRNCYTSTFEISTIKSEDGGEITFIAGNSKGMSDVVIYLNVTKADFSVSKASSGLKSQSIILLCLIILWSLFMK